MGYLENLKEMTDHSEQTGLLERLLKDHVWIADTATLGVQRTMRFIEIGTMYTITRKQASVVMIFVEGDKV